MAEGTDPASDSVLPSDPPSKRSRSSIGLPSIKSSMLETLLRCRVAGISFVVAVCRPVQDAAEYLPAGCVLASQRQVAPLNRLRSCVTGALERWKGAVAAFLSFADHAGAAFLAMIHR